MNGGRRCCLRVLVRRAPNKNNNNSSNSSNSSNANNNKTQPSPTDGNCDISLVRLRDGGAGGGEGWQSVSEVVVVV